MNQCLYYLLQGAKKKKNITLNIIQGDEMYNVNLYYMCFVLRMYIFVYMCG